MRNIVDGKSCEMSPQEQAKCFANLSEPQLEDISGFVSARQFKLQLLKDGLLERVDAWVASQPREIQIAYEYSGRFSRSDPMTVAGFTEMGFTAPEVTAFFASAAAL
ncbi:hypothetical protein [Rhizobium sp. HT1-10]|uniref:hypothetical protein n=1 Tax=Rhizobium sp. HT1-10 TaxID=3111638 RepID=UPI003C1DE4A2